MTNNPQTFLDATGFEEITDFIDSGGDGGDGGGGGGGDQSAASDSGANNDRPDNSDDDDQEIQITARKIPSNCSDAGVTPGGGTPAGSGLTAAQLAAATQAALDLEAALHNLDSATRAGDQAGVNSANAQIRDALNDYFENLGVP